MNVPGSAMLVVIVMESKTNDKRLIRMKRLTGVRAFIVVMTIGNQTRCERREVGKWMRKDHDTET